ncbi:hypothetical protein HT031_006199 [Scenedesmus sp. PABB004]|nr:hypothetical protein HT031_006199 [Scenedesmus sp. PABB004]
MQQPVQVTVGEYVNEFFRKYRTRAYGKSIAANAKGGAEALMGMLKLVLSKGGREELRIALHCFKDQIAAALHGPLLSRHTAVEELFALLASLIDAAERLRQFSPVKESISAAVLEEVRWRLYRVVVGDAFVEQAEVRRRALDIVFTAYMREQALTAQQQARSRQLAAAPGAAAAAPTAAAAAAGPTGGSATSASSGRSGSPRKLMQHLGIAGGGRPGSPSKGSRLAFRSGALAGPDVGSWEGLWGSLAAMSGRRMLPLLQSVMVDHYQGSRHIAGSPAAAAAAAAASSSKAAAKQQAAQQTVQQHAQQPAQAQQAAPPLAPLSRDASGSSTSGAAAAADAAGAGGGRRSLEQAPAPGAEQQQRCAGGDGGAGDGDAPSDAGRAAADQPCEPLPRQPPQPQRQQQRRQQARKSKPGFKQRAPGGDAAAGLDTAGSGSDGDAAASDGDAAASDGDAAASGSPGSPDALVVSAACAPAAGDKHTAAWLSAASSFCAADASSGGGAPPVALTARAAGASADTDGDGGVASPCTSPTSGRRGLVARLRGMGEGVKESVREMRGGLAARERGDRSDAPSGGGAAASAASGGGGPGWVPRGWVKFGESHGGHKGGGSPPGDAPGAASPRAQAGPAAAAVGADAAPACFAEEAADWSRCSGAAGGGAAALAPSPVVKTS